jgi:hypothetical protein
MASAGCALSRSSSESSSAISGSALSISVSLSSSASSSGAADNAYAQDVTAATVAFVESGPVSREPFLREVGRIAEDHGITDWQQRDGTYRAIGAGLRLGDVDESSTRAFAARIFREEERAGAEILAGYRGAEAP